MKRSQKGFSIIEALIILFIILLLALIGWWIWQQNQEKEEDTKQEEASQQSQNSEQDEVQDNQTYLVINEWGVRFKTGADNIDAYYVIEQGKPDYAYVSLNSLKNVDDCAADKTSVGVYTRFTKDDIDPIYEEKYIDLYPNAPKVGNYYFIFTQPQAYCSDNQATITKSQAATQAFKANAATVEANP